jgi:predicted enzyme related to lactoylglutathione lyase
LTGATLLGRGQGGAVDWFILNLGQLNREAGHTNWDIIVSKAFRSSRDVIIRTNALSDAATFYESVLGLSAVRHSDTLIGFETGAFCLYVESGERHGPVFEFLAADIEDAKRELLTAGCVVVEENASMPRCYIQDPFGVVFNLCQVPPGK